MNNKKHINLFYATIGTFFLSVGIAYFLIPSKLVTGGVSGIAIVIEYLTGTFFNNAVPVWLSNLVLNIPLLIIGFKIKGFKFLATTLYCTVLLSFFLFVMGFVKFNPMTNINFFLASVYGGVIAGFGLGLVFRGLSSTGGTDLLAIIINHKIKYVSIPKIIFLLDATIIVTGLVVFGLESAMYALISIFISSKIMENTLEGLNFSKALFIISDKSLQISEQITAKLDRGVTGLHGKGMYTNNERTVLLSVVSIKEIAQIKEIVMNIDPNSFVIVADVREVLGEGFKSFV